MKILGKIAELLGSPQLQAVRPYAEIAALRYSARYLASIDEPRAALQCSERARQILDAIDKHAAPCRASEPEVDVTVWDDPDLKA